MRYPILLLCLLLLAAAASAQTFRIVDDEGTPVGYANAYLPSAGTGTVADGGGNVALTAAAIVAAPDSTAVTISAVGFRDTTLALGALRRVSELPLSAVEYGLVGVEVAAEGFTDARRAGLRVRHPPLTKCLVGYDRGEFGAAFEVRRECAVDAVTLDLSYGRKADRVVEVNVYGIDSVTGKPRKRLHERPYRYTIPAEARGRYALTLPELDRAVVMGWVAVTTEILEVDATLALDTRCRGTTKHWSDADREGFNPIQQASRPKTYKHLAVNRAEDGTWTYHPIAPAIEVKLMCSK